MKPPNRTPTFGFPHLLLPLVLFAAILAPGCRGNAGGGASAQLPPEDVILDNARGSALLGQQETERAIGEFKLGIAKRPADPVLLSNLGLAETLKGDFEGAEQHQRQALAADGNFIPAHFRLGVILKQKGAVEEAIAEFERVGAADPNDVVTWYHLGSLRTRKGDLDLALTDFEKALTLDPTHISTLYGMGRALIQKGEAERGSEMLAKSQKIREETGLGETVGLQYGEQGKYSVATEYSAKDLKAPPAVPVRYGIDAQQHLGAVEALLDANGDGRVDALAGFADGAPALLIGAGDGTFQAISGVGLPPLQKEAGRAVFPGDLNNDGTLDLLLTGGSLLVWKGVGGGRFEDETQTCGLAKVGKVGGALLSDMDHDGDLDVIVSPAGTTEPAVAFYVNGGDGRFASRGSTPLKGRMSSAVLLAATDFDNDRDVDIVGIPTGGKSAGGTFILSNRRDGSYDLIVPTLSGPLPAARSLSLADLDKDGFMDILVAGQADDAANGVVVLRNKDGHGLETYTGLAKAVTPGAGYNTLAVAAVDFDNDGFLDLATLRGEGGGSSNATIQLVRNAGAGLWEAGPSTTLPLGGANLFAADLDGDGDLDLIAGGAVLRATGAESQHWAEVNPRGIRDNRFGAGTKVEFRAGALWQKFEAGPSGLPVHMGLGPRDRLDGVRLLWPGGVLQDEIEVSLGQRQEIAQLDRKGTSCPILYAWDGAAMRFVTDFLGGCAIGYLEEPGRWSIPDTDEYVKIPGERLASSDGFWDLRMVNQLEEVIFFDRAQLLVVDHPARVDVFPDERLMPSPPFPPFRLILAGGIRPPRAAHDDAGRDVLDRVREEDRKTVDGFVLMPFKGYAKRHDLLLDLGSLDGAEQIVLLLDGWIDYADSTSNLAAAQSGAALMPPRLDARRSGGTWRSVLPSMGFPAGLPKTMTVDLTGKLEPGENEIRIRTSMRIYWDRIRVATEGRGEAARVTRLDPAAATLRFLGYPREFSPDGAAPKIYDYSRILPAAPWKAHAGAYTRFGDVRELLLSVDDHLVVTKHGDEIALRFDSSAAPELPEGWKRDFLLYADGFGKDMDVNSARPDTVGPLPFHAMPSFPYPEGLARGVLPGWEELLDRVNTRIVPPDRLGAPGAAPAPGAGAFAAASGGGGGGGAIASR